MFGVFIFVGYIPESTVFDGKVTTDRNYIVSDETMKTSVEGVFVAGDVRSKKNLDKLLQRLMMGLLLQLTLENMLKV